MVNVQLEEVDTIEVVELETTTVIIEDSDFEVEIIETPTVIELEPTINVIEI